MAEHLVVYLLSVIGLMVKKLAFWGQTNHVLFGDQLAWNRNAFFYVIFHRAGVQRNRAVRDRLWFDFIR